MSLLTEPALARPEAAGIKKGYRVILLTALSIAGIALLCHFALMLWGQHEFSTPESVVASQSMMLAHDGMLYYGLARLSVHRERVYAVVLLARCGLDQSRSGSLYRRPVDQLRGDAGRSSLWSG